MSIILVSYDFADDKIRTKFSKFLKKYGRKIQYSVYEIKNSPRILSLIQLEIERVYAKKFTNADSILVFPISEADEDKIQRYGYPAQEEEDVLFM
jgi:CRISPR-associated protein Cas2